jgi:hypothetical protein
MPYEFKKWYLRDTKRKAIDIIKHDAKINLKLV